MNESLIGDSDRQGGPLWGELTTCTRSRTGSSTSYYWRKDILSSASVFKDSSGQKCWTYFQMCISVSVRTCWRASGPKFSQSCSSVTCLGIVLGLKRQVTAASLRMKKKQDKLLPSFMFPLCKYLHNHSPVVNAALSLIPVCS